MAATLLVMVPVIVLFFFAQKAFVAGRHADRSQGMNRPRRLHEDSQ